MTNYAAVADEPSSTIVGFSCAVGIATSVESMVSKGSSSPTSTGVVVVAGALA